MEDALAEMAQQEEERMMGERAHWEHAAQSAHGHPSARAEGEAPRTPSPGRSSSSRTGGLHQEHGGLEALMRAYEDDEGPPPLPGGPGPSSPSSPSSPRR